MAPRTAALVLVAATVIVGAVGYVVLSVVASESTNTASSCTTHGAASCPSASDPGAVTPRAVHALDGLAR
jgi:hypothetical protein